MKKRHFIAGICCVLSWSLLVGGCARTVRTAAPLRSHMETVAFTTTEDRVAILDAAT